jgi:CRISPR/Cas system Type II protein with McrA/HNH and RuvC-like nuclease domain
MTYDEFWVSEFGNCEYAYDFAQIQIKRSDFRNEYSQFSWDIDHIQPISKSGPDNISNLQITNMQVNRIKADKTTFEINNISYQVKKTKNLYQEDRLAEYPYDDKKYCIVILVPEYSN